MIEKICICDRCGKQTDKPVMVTFNEYDLESESITKPAFQKEGRHYCSICADIIYSGTSLKYDNKGNESGKDTLDKIVDALKKIFRDFDSIGANIINVDASGDVHIYDIRAISNITRTPLFVESVVTDSPTNYMVSTRYHGIKFHSFHTKNEVKAMGLCISE